MNINNPTRILSVLLALIVVLTPSASNAASAETPEAPQIPASLALAVMEPATASDTVAAVESVAQAGAPDLFSQQYTSVTKRLLLTGIELERYSLHFRIENGKQPKFRRLRFFLAQEAGAAGGLVFETVGDKEFHKGRSHPLQINKRALHESLTTTMTCSIIAGSGSAIELGSNMLQAVKNKKAGYDHHSANEFVFKKLKEIDALLAERDALVEANKGNQAYDRAVVEGRVLHAARNSFINEYSHFYADTRGFLTYQNVFYALNASYNTVGAIAANTAYRAVLRPHLNGTANILFIVSGGMATVTPVISTAAGVLARKQAVSSLKQKFGQSEFDPKRFDDDLKSWDALSASPTGSLMPTFPGAQRYAFYTQSNALFTQQLDNEVRVMRKLNKVALQSSILGPVIGSTLMTQGILGTYGFYHYPVQPRKQINQFYCGSVVGTVGTSMALLGNAGSLFSGYVYEHKLAKEHRLPADLCAARLKHLDEAEKAIQAI